MFLQLDGTFWFQLINFAIFYAIFRVIFLNPVGEALRKRRAYIEAVQNDYLSSTAQAKALRAEGEALRAAARREAEETVVRARASAEGEAQRIAADFGTQAGNIADDARATVESEVATARSLEPELAKTLAQSLLDRAMGALGA